MSEKPPFVDLDEDEQVRKWGKRIFRQGPWRGAGYSAIKIEPSDDPIQDERDRQALIRAEAERTARYGAV